MYRPYISVTARAAHALDKADPACQSQWLENAIADGPCPPMSLVIRLASLTRLMKIPLHQSYAPHRKRWPPPNREGEPLTFSHKFDT
jgi:hypothetical protein